MHVYEDLNGRIPLILDGGKSEGGIESTVCDCTGDYPVILRPGLITREMIAKVLGRCDEYAPDLENKQQVKSPGMLYKHYAPRCKTLLFSQKNVKNAISRYVTESQENKGIAVLCEEKWISEFEKMGAKCLNLGKNQAEMASRLYKLLREAERVCDTLIVIEPQENGGIMTGVLNRLRKACTSQDVQEK